MLFQYISKFWQNIMKIGVFPMNCEFLWNVSVEFLLDFLKILYNPNKVFGFVWDIENLKNLNSLDF